MWSGKSKPPSSTVGVNRERARRPGGHIHVDERGSGRLLTFLFFRVDRKGGDTTNAETDDGDCEQISCFEGEVV